ncbi:hypothetical protein PP714_05715 [Lacticaseibacillus paracasei]|nr:hypothetical protein [Lacticaseibacillus paracasei]
MQRKKFHIIDANPPVSWSGVHYANSMAYVLMASTPFTSIFLMQRYADVD